MTNTKPQLILIYAPHVLRKHSNIDRDEKGRSSGKVYTQVLAAINV